MSITFFVENVLESTDVTVTVCNAASTAPGRRLYDRVKALRYAASSSGTAVIIDATGTVHHAVGSIAMINHTATSTAILYGSCNYSAWTSVATFNAYDQDPFYTTLPAISTEYLAWRVRFCADITRLQIGELMLGCAQVVSRNPNLGRLTEGVQGNRVDNESVAGYVWSVRLGTARATYDWAWNVMSCSDWTSLSSAYETADEGAKAFVVVDYNSLVRWSRFTQTSVAAMRVTTPLREVRSEVMEAL